VVALNFLASCLGAHVLPWTKEKLILQILFGFPQSVLPNKVIGYVCLSYNLSLEFGNLVCLLRRRWIDNIKLDLLEIGVSVVDWIGLAQDRYRLRALVNSVMNLRVP
jgi:hypothetical protein